MRINLYQTRQIGDILRLPFDLEHHDGDVVEAGGYVLLSIGDKCCVARLSEAPGGALTTTNRMHYVSNADLCHFLTTGMRARPLDV